MCPQGGKKKDQEAIHYHYPLDTPARAGALCFPQPLPPCTCQVTNLRPPTPSSPGGPGLPLLDWPRVPGARPISNPPERPIPAPPALRASLASSFFVTGARQGHSACGVRSAGGAGSGAAARDGRGGRGAVVPRRLPREASRVSGAGAGPGRRAPVASAEVVDRARLEARPSL